MLVRSQPPVPIYILAIIGLKMETVIAFLVLLSYPLSILLGALAGIHLSHLMILILTFLCFLAAKAGSHDIELALWLSYPAIFFLVAMIVTMLCTSFNWSSIWLSVKPFIIR